MTDHAVSTVLTCYPQIYFACHTRHVRDTDTGVTLSKHQADILNHLDEIEPTSLTELADHMGVTPSTMSLAAKRLVRQGFVMRERDAHDRRVIHLRLSEAGVRVKQQQSVLDPARVAALLDRLTDAERGCALDGLRLLARASGEAMKEYARDRDQAERRLAG